MSLYRDVCNNYHGNAAGNAVLNDNDMLYEYEISHPMTLLRVARLSLFARILVKAPPVLKDLILDLYHVHGSWTQCVVSDFKWLSLCPHFAEQASFGFGEWTEYVSSNCKRFKKHLAKFSKSRIANVVIQDNLPAQDTLVCAPQFSCTLCQKSFGTFQQQSLHSFKAHGIKSLWRLYVDVSCTCQVCMVHFHTRDRLLNHLRYRSKVCKYKMHLRGPVCSAEVALELDLASTKVNTGLYSQGLRNHAATSAAFRIDGPLLPVLLPPGTSDSTHSGLGFGRNY